MIRPTRTPVGAGTVGPLAAILLFAAACGPGESAAPDTGSNGDSEPAAAQAGASNGAGATIRIAATNGAGNTNGAGTANGAGTTKGAGTTAPAITDPEVLEGLRLYRAQYCGTCHRLSLAGTAGVFGPPHDSLRVTAARRIRDPGYTGSATTAEAYVRESVLRPGAYRVPGYEHTRFLMPAYTQLSEAEVDALVHMLLWQPPSEGRHP